jgi:hypothetical protein
VKYGYDHFSTLDYWNSSSYQEKMHGHRGLVYGFGINSYQSKEKVVGGSYNYGNYNMDFKLIFLKSCCIEKEWSYLSPYLNF